jgi:hypothetical protein
VRRAELVAPVLEVEQGVVLWVEPLPITYHSIEELLVYRCPVSSLDRRFPLRGVMGSTATQDVGNDFTLSCEPLEGYDMLQDRAPDGRCLDLEVNVFEHQDGFNPTMAPYVPSVSHVPDRCVRDVELRLSLRVEERRIHTHQSWQ